MGWLYLLLLVLTVGFVAWKGGVEERIAVGTLCSASLATFLLVRTGHRFESALPPFLAIDLTALGIAFAIAYRSSRFWPLPFAALHSLTVLSILSPLFAENLVTYALGVLQGFWAYPQLAILVLAVLRRRPTSVET